MDKAVEPDPFVLLLRWSELVLTESLQQASRQADSDSGQYQTLSR